MKPALVIFEEVKGGFVASSASRGDDPAFLHFQTCIGTTLKSCADKLPEAFEMAQMVESGPVVADSRNWQPTVVPNPPVEGDGNGK